MRRSIIFLAQVILLASCTGSSKTATTTGGKQADRKKAECSKLHVDMNQPHLDWYEADKDVLNKSNEILVLPKDYKVYTIDTAQLSTFFSTIDAGQSLNTAMPLPAPAGCQLFTVKLRQKRGTTVYATGESMGQQVNMSLNNGLLFGMVNWFDIEYEIRSQKILGQTYTLVYEKMPPPPQDTTKPKPHIQLRELRYDK